MIDSIYKVKAKTPNLTTLPSEQECILAAIDIGTNSIHEVVVRIEPTLPTFTIIAREKDTVRLGDRNPKTKELTTEAIARSMAALRRCKDLAASFNADQIIAVATSATRESPNGLDFLAKIEAELGIAVDLISGQEEARRIYLGVLSGMDFNNQPHIIIDIGGGSTELILGDSHEPRFLSSTKVGAVRLTQEFVKTDPLSESEFQYLRAYIRGNLERATDELNLALKPGENARLVGTSGTIETLATIHALERLKTVPNPLSGYQITRKDIKEMMKRFASMNYAERFAVPGMSDKRAEIIVSGTMILYEAMSLLNLDTITICERSLREGMIVDWMLTHGFIESRLRYQSEIRPRNIINIAQKYQVNLEYSQRVAKFALSLFDQLQGILHYWEDQERELLWAAAILHNCGLYISHSARHKHSYYLIRNGELLGFTEIEIELIANIARFHRKSKPKKKYDYYANLSPQNRERVRQISAILRLAVALDRRQIGAISSLECDYNPEIKRLNVFLKPSEINDDCVLELWNFNYKKVVFEEEYGVEVSAILTR
jgi:exopolyphosphatase/guanosine-5'-triphosphate,3'-diphosphate pyrophosphatase